MARILVADDDSGIRLILKEILERAGYDVCAVKNGREALAEVVRKTPDLLLLDVDMPKMSGWDVVIKIKSDTLLRHLPVLFLTSMAQTKNKVQGLRLGADDYITKPFEPKELLARVEGVLRRMRTELEANPLSRLPGNPSIEREIEQRIASGARFAVLYADLNNFKAFNDRYGFKRGDLLIQETAKMLLAAREPGDFVGHVGGDDFIVVTTPERAEPICRKLICAFDAHAPSCYDEEDRNRGFVEVADRQGRLERFPIVGVAIGGVTNVQRALDSIGQVSALGSEVKKIAKRERKSGFVIDRRAK